MNAVIATIRAGKRPALVAVEGRFVWVAYWKRKSVSRIDPTSNTVRVLFRAANLPKNI